MGLDRLMESFPDDRRLGASDMEAFLHHELLCREEFVRSLLEALMTTQRDILQALQGLPPEALEQVNDFILFLKESKGQGRHRPAGEELAKKQMAAIKRWAGKDLEPGFLGKEHDAILYKSDR
jgi:hypothetical protein